MSGRHVVKSAAVLVLAIAVGALGTRPTGAEVEDFSIEAAVEVAAPVSDGARPAERSADLDSIDATARGRAAVGAVEGHDFVGIEYWSSVGGFVVAIDDRLEIVDEQGESMGSLDLPGVVAISASGSYVFAADDLGRIHRVERGETWGTFRLVTWQVVDGPLRTIDNRVSTVMFVAEATPSTIGRFDPRSGEIDDDWLVLGEPVELLGYTFPFAHVTTASSLYTISIGNLGQVAVESITAIESVTDLVSDTHGGTTWLATPSSRIEFAGGTITARDLEPGGPIAAVDYNSNVGFAAGDDVDFDLRVHRVEVGEGLVEAPVALFALEPGQVVVPRGFALGVQGVGAVVDDPECGCLRVVGISFRPTFDGGETVPRLERGPDATLTLAGQGLALVHSVNDGFSGRSIPFTVGPLGRSVSIDLSSYGSGEHRVNVQNHLGGASVAFEIYEPPPEPVEPVEPHFTDSACPWITDSIVRLYSAYFLRAPEEGGFDFWIEGYASGTWSLPRASAFFSQSPEFESMYGQLSDADFIDLIYHNIFGRQADAAGRAYWVDRMAREGIDRGTVMLFFSESPEYIAQTETALPLAGYFNWYPEGTTWACGVGDARVPVPSGTTWVDVGFWNLSDEWPTIEIAEQERGQWVARHHSAMGPGALTVFLAVERPSVVTGIGISSTAENAWTLVFSPIPTSSVREGWND